MRVTLVHVQFHEGNNVFPPLGICYVGAVLRQAGHTVTLLDGDPFQRPELVDDLVASRPEVLGVSLMTMTYGRARWLVQALRERLPGVPIVGGGAHPTADPAGSLRELGFDWACVGEGEQTMLELVARLEAGGPEAVAATPLPGLWTDPDTAPPERPVIEDLSSLPLPARDLLGHETYLRPPGLIRGFASSRIASVLASRGCPFGCTFCGSKSVLGKAVRIRSVEDVLAELRHLVQRDRIRGMYFVDDVFTHDREWTLAFCTALRESELQLEWGCQARVTAVDRELLLAMKAAGCVQVDYGVESGSPRILRKMRKGTTPEQIVAAFDLTHEVGLRTGASFVLGGPGETAEDLALTEQLAERIRSDWTVFFLSTPYPGTVLWRQLAHLREQWPAFGEVWNNRVMPAPMPQDGAPAAVVTATRARLQNRFFRSNYLRRRNLRFALRLVPTLADPQVARTAAKVMTGRGRLDDVVEVAFSTWRGRSGRV